MSRIAITGAGGRMGKALIDAILLSDGAELSVALERPESSLIGVDSGELAGVGKNGILVAGSISDVADQFDVLIDFSVPSATAANAAFCAAHNKKMVIGTTGLDAEQLAQVSTTAASSAICMASNFSTGVNLCFKLAELAAKVLADETDIEILEQDKLIEDEIKKGIIPDPATIDPATGMPFQDDQANMDLGKPVMEPEIDASAAEPIELPKGGEI